MELSVVKSKNIFIQWLKDINIKTKLMLIILVCATSMLLVGLTGLRDLNVIQENLSTISQLYLKSIQYLLELDKDLHQGLLSERNMLLVKNDPGQFEKFLKKYNKDILMDIEKRWDKGFLALKHNWDKEEMQLINEYEKNRDDWLDFSKMIVISLQEEDRKNFDELIQLTLNEGFQKFTKMRENINQLTTIYSERAELMDIESQNTYKKTLIILVTIIVLALLFSVFFGLFIVSIISNPVKMVVKNLQMIAKGNLGKSINIPQKDEIGELAEAYNEMDDYLRKSSLVAEAIGQGNYDISVEVRSDDDVLGNAIDKMKKNLQKMTRENDIQSWLKTGQADLSEKMRGDQSIVNLSKSVINFVTIYLDAKVGAIFLKDNNEILKLTGSYAYKKRKSHSNEYKIGEGLIGQSAMEKQTILISDIPANYMKIISSAGEADPLNILITPLIHDDQVSGVVELGSFQAFTELHLKFLEQSSESIAIAFQSALSRKRVNELLEETQNQTEELHSQQEELRVANEELQAQQEELRVTNEELEEQAHILKKSEEQLKARQLEFTKSNQ